MKKFTLMVLVLVVLLLAFSLTACSTNIADVKIKDNVGHKVIVTGTASSGVALGSLSGYKLTDDTGSIFISTKNLPEEGDKKVVRGTLEKNLLGYYIDNNWMLVFGL